MDISDGKYYFTEEHEWIRFDQEEAVIGLTLLAKKELGPVTNIEVHTIGKDLMENQAFGRITTERYLCKLIMPLRGRVLEANALNLGEFNTVAKDFDPEEWIARIRISHPLVSKQLYSLEDYKAINTEQALHLVKYFLKFDE